VCKAKQWSLQEKALKKCNTQKLLHKGPIYRKLSYFQVTRVRSIASIALEHKHVCDQSWKVRSIARNCLKNSMAQGWKRWRLGQRVRRKLTRLALNRRPWARSLLVRSIAGARNKISLLLPFFTLCNHGLNVRTCNNIKHYNKLKC
jgi:hypothetical protein